jgi:hypothetical protein
VADINLGLRMALHRIRQGLEDEVTKETGYRNLLADVQQVVEHARVSGVWVAIICPDNDTVVSCSQVLAASIPGDAKFSGRTALLDSGRISVALATEEVFIPDKTPFLVSFLGWTSYCKNDGMARWQQKSVEVLHLGE